jgi:HD-GYP domain-containing protein (c-di-GMP phosphodiesterase class II)
MKIREKEDEHEAIAAAQAHQELGLTLINALTRCFKVSVLHDMQNTAVSLVTSELLKLVNKSVNDGEPLLLQTVGEYIFLNREIIRLTGESFQLSIALRETFDQLGINEIIFQDHLTHVDLLNFLSTYQTYSKSASPRDFVREKFEKFSVRAIRPEKSREDSHSRNPKQSLIRTICHLTALVQEHLEQQKQHRPTRIDRIRKSLQKLTDALENTNDLAMGITRYGGLQGDAAFHGVSVAIISILMAKKLRMKRSDLMDIGLVALFHNLGRENFLESSSDIEQAKTMGSQAAQRIPVLSALKISQGALTREILARLVATYETSIPIDSGPGGVVPGGIARMLAVPSAFHLLTSPQPPFQGLTPDHAVQVIIQNHTSFEQAFIKLFVSTVGLFPIGSVVNLSSRRSAIVTTVPGDLAHLTTPTVRIIHDPNGQTAGEIVNLSMSGFEDPIIGAIHPDVFGVNPLHYLLSA